MNCSMHTTTRRSLQAGLSVTRRGSRTFTIFNSCSGSGARSSLRPSQGMRVIAVEAVGPVSRQGVLGGKRIIVTGASRGIGAAITLACARAGAARLVLLARSGNELSAAARAVGDAGAEAVVRPCDVTDTPEMMR